MAKIILEDKIEETHFRDDNIQYHHEKHSSDTWKTYFINNSDNELFEPMTEEEYDAYADELSKMPVRTSDLNSSDDIIGFVNKRGEIIKYRKSLKDLVIYVCNPRRQYTKTYYQVSSDRRYRRLKDNDYLREIEPNDDYYNQ